MAFIAGVAAFVTLVVPSTTAALQADDAPDSWLVITVRVVDGGRAHTAFDFVTAERVPDSLRVRAESDAAEAPASAASGTASSGSGTAEMQPPGVATTDDGRTLLRFAPRPLDELAALLGHLPQDRSEVRMIVRIPPGAQGADMWEFQGMLSAQRIRRVRFETGGALFTRLETGSNLTSDPTDTRFDRPLNRGRP